MSSPASANAAVNDNTRRIAAPGAALERSIANALVLINYLVNKGITLRAIFGKMTIPNALDAARHLLRRPLFTPFRSVVVKDRKARFRRDQIRRTLFVVSQRPLFGLTRQMTSQPSTQPPAAA